MLEKGYSNVHLKSDSLMAVQMINEGTTEDHPYHALAFDSKVLLRHNQSSLTRIYREANRSADHMARLGAEQPEDLVVTKDSAHRCAILCLQMAWALPILGTSLFLLF